MVPWWMWSFKWPIFQIQLFLEPHSCMRMERSLTLVSYPTTSSDWICISTPPSPRGSFLLGRCATYITPERTLMPKQSTSCIKVQHGVLVSLYWLRVICSSRDLHHPTQVGDSGKLDPGLSVQLVGGSQSESLPSLWLGSGGSAESDKHLVLLGKSYSRTFLSSKFLCSHICDFFLTYWVPWASSPSRMECLNLEELAT